jgi:hypothetical protein
MYSPPTRITSKFDPMLLREPSSGHILTYVLPVGFVYDLSTLRVHVTAHHDPCPTVTSTIPSPAECLIETLNVSLGDIQLNQINNYGQLFAAWSRYNTSAADFGRRMMTSCAGSYQQPTDTRVKGEMHVILSSWLGLLGSGALIDTSVRGPLKFEITLADESVTGTRFSYQSFLTVDELPNGQGTDVIPYADYRTSITYNDGLTPYGVIQTDNFEDHRLQYVLGTMLYDDYKDPARSVLPVKDLGFTHGFRHSRMKIHSYYYEFDGHKFSHNIMYTESLDRLREAMAAGNGPSNLELPLLICRGNDMSLEELCENIFMTGESALNKGLPDGVIEVTFKTRYGNELVAVHPCYVFTIARYLCFV